MRIGAEFPLPVVVIGIINCKHREPIGHEFSSRRVRFHNVSRLFESVGNRTGPEVIAALVLEIVKLEAGVWPLRHAEDFADFSLHIEELVQFHLLPIIDAGIVGVRINPLKVDMRIAHGLEQKPLERFAVRMKDFDFRIDG